MMTPTRKTVISNFPFLRKFASLKITVVSLLLLFILTLWGTIAQVDQGLFYAQERYFHSFWFLIGGFLPFPGAQLVLWILFFNLAAAAAVRLIFQWKFIGILLIHFGLLLYFVAAFVTLHKTVESQVTLLEGEATNVSTFYHDWELSVWKLTQDAGRDVAAHDIKGLKKGNLITFKDLIPHMKVLKIITNARPQMNMGETPEGLSASKLTTLLKNNPKAEPEENIPGLLIESQEDSPRSMLFYGEERRPLLIAFKGVSHALKLRRKRTPLPFLIKLKKFHMEKHPNTEIARSYESLVEIDSAGVKRDVLIKMNEPLRYKNFTLYQASYSIDQLGRERSTLAVVENSGRLLPYIASLVTFLGLVMHFLTMAFNRKFQKARMK